MVHKSDTENNRGLDFETKEKYPKKDSTSSLKNFVFCNEKREACRGGEYRIIIGDHIAYRYEIKKSLGAGVYGQVVAAYDHASNTEVALKIMNNHTSLATRMHLEYHAVRFIKRHVEPIDEPFVIGALDILNFRNHQVFVYEMLGDSLNHEYHSKFDEKSKIIKGDELKTLAWDILEGLAVLKKTGLIHNDLKPHNILETNEEYPSVKIIDYGLSCYRASQISSIPEEKRLKCPKARVQSRYYRSPEVLLGLNYTTQSDMWSFGCIIGELYRGTEMFYGENDVDQMAAIMEIIGLPPRELIFESEMRKDYFEAVNYKTKSGFQRKPWRKSLEKVLVKGDDMFLDFMDKVLEWDSEARLTPLQAMQHPWLSEFAKQRFLKLSKYL